MSYSSGPVLVISLFGASHTLHQALPPRRGGQVRHASDAGGMRPNDGPLQGPLLGFLASFVQPWLRAMHDHLRRRGSLPATSGGRGWGRKMTRSEMNKPKHKIKERFLQKEGFSRWRLVQLSQNTLEPVPLIFRLLLDTDRSSLCVCR